MWAFLCLKSSFPDSIRIEFSYLINDRIYFHYDYDYDYDYAWDHKHSYVKHRVHDYDHNYDHANAHVNSLIHDYYGYHHALFYNFLCD